MLSSAFFVIAFLMVLLISLFLDNVSWEFILDVLSVLFFASIIFIWWLPFSYFIKEEKWTKQKAILTSIYSVFVIFLVITLLQIHFTLLSEENFFILTIGSIIIWAISLVLYVVFSKLEEDEELKKWKYIW